MIHYLYLPYRKCKNCKRFDPSAAKTYTCDPKICPASEVQLVIRDSVTDLAARYKTAVRMKDFNTQAEILATIKKCGKGFEYKFKKELG